MDAPASDVCPRCGAPRARGSECPSCGVIYAKARPRPAPSPAVEPVEPPVPPVPADPAQAAPTGDARGLLPGAASAVWGGEVDDARRELLVRAIAPPAALLVAWALVSSGAGHMLVRTFLSMWVHELGHAVVAWWSGYGAFPGPWRTPVSTQRMPLVTVALAAGLLALVWRGWRARRPAWMALGSAGLAAQLVCTLLPPGAARQLGIFGGDAGCLVLGALGVATIWTPPDGPLGRGALRWGFLAIGASALVDALDTWVKAARDPGTLPLGEIEGVGLSDASRLIEVYGWSPADLTGRYVTLGVACLTALGLGYVVGLLRARAVLAASEAVAPR